MSKKLVRIWRSFCTENKITEDQERIVIRALCAGWNAAQDDNKRHRSVRSFFRDLIAKGDQNYDELPY